MKTSISFKEGELISALQSNDQNQKGSALKFIYENNFPKVAKFIIQNSGTEEEAKDIFQDAIVIFNNKIENKRFQGASSIGTFLFGIAKNLWLNTLSKKKRYQNFTEEMKHRPVEEFQELNDLNSANNSIIESLMSQIGEGCKNLLIDYYYENQPTLSIKQKMALGSEQAVRNKIYRCMQKLRNICTQNNITMANFSIDED